MPIISDSKGSIELEQTEYHDKHKFAEFLWIIYALFKDNYGDVDSKNLEEILNPTKVEESLQEIYTDLKFNDFDRIGYFSDPSQYNEMSIFYNVENMRRSSNDIVKSYMVLAGYKRHIFGGSSRTITSVMRLYFERLIYDSLFPENMTFKESYKKIDLEIINTSNENNFSSAFKALVNISRAYFAVWNKREKQFWEQYKKINTIERHSLNVINMLYQGHPDYSLKILLAQVGIGSYEGDNKNKVDEILKSYILGNDSVLDRENNSKFIALGDGTGTKGLFTQLNWGVHSFPYLKNISDRKVVFSSTRPRRFNPIQSKVFALTAKLKVSRNEQNLVIGGNRIFFNVFGINQSYDNLEKRLKLQFIVSTTNINVTYSFPPIEFGWANNRNEGIIFGIDGGKIQEKRSFDNNRDPFFEIEVTKISTTGENIVSHEFPFDFNVEKSVSEDGVIVKKDLKCKFFYPNLIVLNNELLGNTNDITVSVDINSKGDETCYLFHSYRDEFNEDFKSVNDIYINSHYDPDSFEIDSSNSGLSNTDIEKIAQLISRHLTYKIEVQLFGLNIGKLYDPNQNEDYSKPNPDQTETGTANEKQRFSFFKMRVNETNMTLNIFVYSFVDPTPSRLNDKLIDPNLLNNFTLAVNPKFNLVLSGLRSFSLHNFLYERLLIHMDTITFTKFEKENLESLDPANITCQLNVIYPDGEDLNTSMSFDDYNAIADSRK